LKKIINNPWVVGTGCAVIAGIILFLMFGTAVLKNEQINKNTTFQNSPNCNGDNCQQIINYAQEKSLVYTSPSKKLIKHDIGTIEFDVSLINNNKTDLNEVGIVLIYPKNIVFAERFEISEYGGEQINKYNDSLHIKNIGFGSENDKFGYYVQYIGTVGKYEEKKFKIKLDTRNYRDDYYLYIKWTEIEKDSELDNFFRSFGVE